MPTWIARNLRWEGNATKRGTGRLWERKCLGFSIHPEGKIAAAPARVERFQTKVRELWRRCQRQTGAELRDNGRAYLRGWWGYYRLAEERRNSFGREGWLRRHIRAGCWPRWDNWRGRRRKLRALGRSGRGLKVAPSSQGAWHIAASPSVQTALCNGVLRCHGFWMPSDLAATVSRAAACNRRMRKTARPMVWEGAGAQSPAHDPIARSL